MFDAGVARETTLKYRKQNHEIDELMRNVEYVVDQQCKEGMYIAHVPLYDHEFSVVERVQEKLISLGFKCEMVYNKGTSAPSSLVLDWFKREN